MTTILLDLHQDAQGAFHYQAHPHGQPRPGTALCGISVADMRSAAWFPVGDPRGDVHLSRACDDCRARLVV